MISPFEDAAQTLRDGVDPSETVAFRASPGHPSRHPDPKQIHPSWLELRDKHTGAKYPIGARLKQNDGRQCRHRILAEHNVDRVAEPRATQTLPDPFHA
jgi:hypothetical protein